jgi:cobalt-zinc-cadmium efflux system membrane fusion protein
MRSLTIVPVTEHVFRTKIVTDGYLTPGGGPAAGSLDTPILGGQSDALLQAESDLITASGQVRLAEAAEKRQYDLYLSDGAPLKDWQQSQADLVTARAQQASARNRLRVLGQTDAGIAAIEKDLHGAAGGPGEFAVHDFSTLWIVANVREADAAQVHLGDTVEVSVPAYPGRRFLGTVGYRGAMIDPVSHRLQIGARLKNNDHLLMPNMQATVTLIAGDAGRSLAVPSQAVIYDGSHATVWASYPDGSLGSRSVTTGRLDGDLLEIVRGLQPGDRVVSSGALFIDSAGGAGE